VGDALRLARRIASRAACCLGQRAATAQENLQILPGCSGRTFPLPKCDALQKEFNPALWVIFA
jgi:hypothetical protein